jgi:hypothetical protein
MLTFAPADQAGKGPFANDTVSVEMSAWGHSQTFALQKVMSVLFPIADIVCVKLDVG